jgi:uncharacterized protein (TIGR02118 family)
MSLRISVYYHGEGRFDHDYYVQTHAPMVYGWLKEYGCRSLDVDKGVSGGPGQPSQYVAAGHMKFDSIEDFQRGFAAHGKAIQDDVANYTDLESRVQISEISASLP